MMPLLQHQAASAARLRYSSKQACTGVVVDPEDAVGALVAPDMVG